jgi:hypothetical protein
MKLAPNWLVKLTSTLSVGLKQHLETNGVVNYVGSRAE